MKIKGLMHIHSSFSDGESSLLEIKEKARLLGMSFVFLADHASLIESDKELQQFKEQCRQLSDKSFLFIPGFEIETEEGYHVLVYNTEKVIQEGIPWTELIDFYKNEKNIFVALAHASQFEKKPSGDFLRKIDGIEIWNSKYDSKLAPNIKVLKWAKEENLIPLAGLDAHSCFVFGKLWIEMDVGVMSVQNIIECLRKNSFQACNGSFCINLNNNFNAEKLSFFRLVNRLYSPIRKTAVFMVKKGFKPPRIIKKIFHKIY